MITHCLSVHHQRARWFLGGLLVWFSLVLPGVAQQAAAPAPDSAGRTTLNEEVFVLSPFEVSAEQDHGYQAITTLAGGRIQTDLKDTPATISIITKEFMDDLALNSTVDFADWAPNAEIPFTDNGFLDEYRTTSRGLSPSFGSRNYFRSYAGGDTYNTERLEFARGPNALLFGDASIGGITTVWTKQARLNRIIANLQTRFDSYGSYRASMDYNVSKSNRFAVRANAVYYVNESWRDIEQSEAKGLHLATTVGLAKNTQFRLEGEYFEKATKIPFSRMVDQVSNYLSLTPAQQAAAIWSATRTTAFPTGTTRFSTDRLTFIESLPDAGVLNYLNRGRTTGSGLSLIPDGRGEVAGFPELPSREFNPNAPSADLEYETSTASAYLDQRIGNDLFLQAAVNWSLPKNVRDEIRWDDVYIDVNEYLPGVGNAAANGQKNPYYGQIFGDEESRRLNVQNELYEYRVMAAWKFENSWTTQSFSALLSQREDEYLSARFRQVPRGIKSGTTYYSSNSTADLIYHRRYWNDLGGGDYVMPATFTNSAGSVLPIEWRQYEDTKQQTTLTAFQLANVGKYFSGRLSIVTGYRYDKYDRIDSTIVSRFGATSPDNGKPSEVILDPAKRLVQTESSPSVGVVYWLFKGLGLSANYAESFNLATSGAEDIYGRPMGPSNAVGEDFGLRFDLFDSRLTGSVLYYENESQGGAVTPDTTNIYNRIRDIWLAVDTSQSISTFRDTQSTRGKGYEAELVYNPTRGWRMRLTAGKPYNTVTDRLPALKQYIAENRGRWETNGSLPTVRTGAEATVKGTLDELDLYLDNNAADDMRSTGAYKWNASYFTSYRFMDGRLKGLTLGAGARYTAERFIARTSVVDSSGRNQYTDWWNDDMILFNAMAKYEFKLNNKPATIQLNVDNLLNNDQFLYRNLLAVGGVNYYHSYQWTAPLKIVGTASIRF